MSMVENHFTLNLAYNGSHYARVEFAGSMMEDEVKRKANQIADAMTNSYGEPSKWSFNLTKVHCHGESVSFKY